MASPTVMVAGAGGFLGGWLTRRLLDEGAAVRAVDVKPVDAWFQHDDRAEAVVADLRELAACRAAVDGIESVYDFACDMGGMGFIESHKAACMLSVLIGTHLLLAARDAGVERFFFASSACVYAAAKQDAPDLRPLRETDAYPAMPEDGYGWEKLFTERMCRHFTEDFGLTTRVARFHNVYGPRGAWTGGREKAPAAICRKVAVAAATGADEIEVWGDGRQTRSFTFVDDAIDGTLALMAGPSGEPLNVGSAETVTIDDLVDLVMDIAGVSLTKRYDLTAPQGVRGRSSDNTRIREVLGWAPTTPLRLGLERTYAWVRAQVDATSGPS